jgi:hypothetical protein
MKIALGKNLTMPSVRMLCQIAHSLLCYAPSRTRRFYGTCAKALSDPDTLNSIKNVYELAAWFRYGISRALYKNFTMSLADCGSLALALNQLN